jgi:hypothetical protein
MQCPLCSGTHRGVCKWAAYTELGRARFVPEPVGDAARDRARPEQRRREAAVTWAQDIGKQALLEQRLDVAEVIMPR